MKFPRAPHRWDVSPRRAIAIQRELAGRISRKAPGAPLRIVAGLDCAFSADGERCIAGAVVWDVDSARVLEERVATRPLRFPYVPGLLSFREAPALLAVLRRLRSEPDALLFDGHGFAHPRRFGIACHVGLIVDRPSAGCAKSRLVGEHEEPASRRGSRRPLRHGDETIGSVLRTREGAKPVYASVGHRLDLEAAERLILDCGAGYRLPEPTRLADRLVARAKNEGA